MADMAASVLARLKNKAAATGRSHQLCMQLFCQEEFLRRLERSKYAENFVLKGGLFVYAVTDFDSRVTVDVDFLLRKIPNTPEQVQAVLEEIIAVPTENDFVTFEIKSVGPIAVTKKYAGVGASLVARIKNTKTPFSIDIGVGDVIVPKQEKRQIPTQLEGFDAPMINTYSLETTIAEKLDAILNLMEFSSRMKDYYKLEETFTGAIELDKDMGGEYEPATMKKGGAKNTKKSQLDEVIEKFNEFFAGEITEGDKILAGILMDKMSQDEVLRKSALHDGEQIFENSVFSKAYDKTAMDSFKESREVFGTLFSDPKKYGALKKALAAIMYREFRKNG